MAEKNPARSKRGNAFLAKFLRKGTSKHDEDESRKKAFTKWINMKLARRDPPSEVNDLIEDIQGGELLFDLLEVLLEHTLEKAREDLQGPQQNIHKALYVLDMQGVESEENTDLEIVEGNEKTILDLIWNIILRFQVEDAMKEVVIEKSTKNYAAEKKLRHWCHGRLKSYKKAKVTDFSLSWKNGLAFNALLHSYKPDMFEYKSLLTQSSEERLNHAFSVATEKFRVPQLLETTDVNVAKPDKNLIMMYVCTLYEYLEGSMAKEHVAEETPDVPDAGKTVSPLEPEKVLRQLKEVEEKISQTEEEKSVHNEQERLNSLDNSKKELDNHQKYVQDLEFLKSQTDDALQDGRRMIDEGYVDKEEEEQFGERMDSIDRRMKQLLGKTEHNRDQLSQNYAQLLQQQLEHISQWVAKGEEKMKNDKESKEYEEVKKQLEDHQKFQDELGDISFITSTLEADESDPNVSEQTHDDLKKIQPLWKNVWEWSEEHKKELTGILEHWQECQEEETVILDWLEEKLKMFREVSQVDLADEEKVNEQLERLEETQKELDEQDLRLKKLEDCWEKLAEKVGEGSAAAEKIWSKVVVFTKCWEKAGKKVLKWKEWLITSRKKMKELQEYMDSVNEWIDGTEREMSEYKDDMDEEEKSKIKDKIEIKCVERLATEKKVDGINRLGTDLSETLRGPWPKAIREDVDKLNERWQNVTAALESFSDKGYPDNSKECCLFRIFKRKVLS